MTDKQPSERALAAARDIAAAMASPYCLLRTDSARIITTHFLAYDELLAAGKRVIAGTHTSSLPGRMAVDEKALVDLAEAIALAEPEKK